MKTLRLTVISLVAVASAVVAFAAPNAPWSVRRDAKFTEKPAVTAPANCAAKEMKNGKCAVITKCCGETKPVEAKECKSQCGS
jgi:hypothetical protein